MAVTASLPQEVAASERVAGYRDAMDRDAPKPSGNRSHSYRHGFAVCCADRAGKPAFGCAARARRKADIAEERDNV